jgi:hypothetical protein
MQWALRPLVRRRHPEAFWRGWRLMATDGTQLACPAFACFGRRECPKVASARNVSHYEVD